MSETTNTAALANKVFDEIFQWLKWELCTPKDINWECCNQEKHNTKTHPSDIVFYYKDPYTGKVYQPIHYIGDFLYVADGCQQVCEELKGFATDTFRLKFKLVIHKYPEIKFVLLKKIDF